MVAAAQAQRLERLQIDGDAIVAWFHRVLTLNRNALVQYRRVACRCCWGADGRYQYTPSEFPGAKLKWERERGRLREITGTDIGEFAGIEGDWYDKRRPIHPDCPECFGEGVGEVFIQDTRYLPEPVRQLYAGLMTSPGGVTVLMPSAEKAGEMLARLLGLFNQARHQEAPSPPPLDHQRLQALFIERMDRARERQRATLAGSPCPKPP